MEKEATEGVKEIVEKIQRRIDHERDQRRKSIKDLLFVDSEDGQWEEEAVNKRLDRPRYTIDLISGEIDRIVSNQRQTTLSIRVEAGKDGKVKTAKVINGIIRNIENSSGAENIYDAAFTEAVKCGYGGWRVYADWDESNPFIQTIKLSPINSAVSSLYFGKSEGFACEDATWGCVITTIPKEEFKRDYPKASVQDFPRELYSWAYDREWIDEDSVRIAEYFEKEQVKRQVALLSDDRVIDLEDEADALDELYEKRVYIVEQKEIYLDKIKRYVINAVEDLEKPKYIPGKYIPLIPIFGKTSFIEGKRFWRGVVRKAIDSQRIFNYSESAKIEAVALSPKDPFFATPTMVGKYQKQWENFNVKSMPIMLYDPDPQIPGGKPERAGSPSLQQALIEQAAAAKENIRAILGDDRAEMRSILPKSEGAVESEQNLTDSKAYIFQDNMLKSKEQTGRVILSMMQEVMDTERMEKIIGEDGQEEDVMINQTVFDNETGKDVLVNDLSLGTYSVIVKTGPTSPTKRKETARQLNDFVAESPEMKMLFADIIVDNMDLNSADEVKKRIRKQQINQGLVEPTDDEIKEYGLDQPAPPDPMRQVLIENVAMQNEKLKSDIENTMADTQKKLYEAQSQSVKAMKDMIEALGKKLELIGLDETDKDAYDGQKALVQDATIDTLRTNELGGSKSIDMKEAEISMQAVQGQPTGPVGPRPAPMLPEGFQQ